MKMYHNYGFVSQLNEAARSSIPNITTILLSKLDSYNLWKWVNNNCEDGICEDLTWESGIVYNCQHFNYDHMYKRLFELKYKGVNLGQE